MRCMIPVLAFVLAMFVGACSNEESTAPACHQPVELSADLPLGPYPRQIFAGETGEWMDFHIGELLLKYLHHGILTGQAKVGVIGNALNIRWEGIDAMFDNPSELTTRELLKTLICQMREGSMAVTTKWAGEFFCLQVGMFYGVFRYNPAMEMVVFGDDPPPPPPPPPPPQKNKKPEVHDVTWGELKSFFR